MQKKCKYIRFQDETSQDFLQKIIYFLFLAFLKLPEQGIGRLVIFCQFNMSIDDRRQLFVCPIQATGEIGYSFNSTIISSINLFCTFFKYVT